MAERREFEMTPEQHAKLLEACKPVPYMVIGGVAPMSAQERANAAWDALGREMGFVGNTARPIWGKSEFFFSAEPTS